MFNPLEFYKALANETRLKSLLLMWHFKQLCVCDLVSALELSQPKISRHLSALRQTAMVSTEKRGKWVYYQLHPDMPGWALEVLRLTLQHNPSYLQANLARLHLTTYGQSCC